MAADRSRDKVPLTAAQMTASLQGHLKVAGLSTHVLSFQVGGCLNTSMADTADDEVLILSGVIAERNMGTTIGAPVDGSKRHPSQSYSDYLAAAVGGADTRFPRCAWLNKLP